MMFPGRDRGHTPGLKPLFFGLAERPKAEALGYLDVSARTTATAKRATASASSGLSTLLLAKARTTSLGMTLLCRVEGERFARGANTPPFAKRAKDGAPGFVAGTERRFALCANAHLSDDEAVAKMGHPGCGGSCDNA
jgi:hypothetical protein